MDNPYKEQVVLLVDMTDVFHKSENYHLNYLQIFYQHEDYLAKMQKIFLFYLFILNFFTADD